MCVFENRAVETLLLVLELQNAIRIQLRSAHLSQTTGNRVRVLSFLVFPMVVPFCIDDFKNSVKKTLILKLCSSV